MRPQRVILVFRGVLPWLVACLLLYFLFARYPASQVAEAATHVNPLTFSVFMVTYFVVFSLADFWGLQRTLWSFNVIGSLREIAALRLASNLGMILNYAFGQGVLAYMIKRSFGDSFLRVSSVLALIIAADLYLAVCISFAATFMTPVVASGYDFAPMIRLVWSGLTAMFLLTWCLRYFHVRKGGFNRLESARMVRLLNLVGPSACMSVLLRRIPLSLIASSYFYFLAMCFDVYVPLEKVFALLPIAVVIGAIPITPGGLGTVQITSTFLFQGLVAGPAITAGEVEPAEIIVAMSLMFTFSMYCLKLFSGAFFFPRALNIRVPGR